MRLTTFSDYTLRTLMYLALRPGSLCTVDEIAAAYDISTHHLTKVVHQAALAGELVTVRGRSGGLRLARAPERVNVGAVLRRTEPDLEIAPCFCAADACAIQPACVLQNSLREALEAFLAVLDRVTLADLVRPKQHLADLLKIAPAAEQNAATEFGHRQGSPGTSIMSGATSWAVVWMVQGSEGRTHHGSRELALNAACYSNWRPGEPLRIEGPNDVVIEQEAIEQHCKSRPRRP
jgi:Rrf2 family nitric oxide-sensitive transcriptional repressor